MIGRFEKFFRDFVSRMLKGIFAAVWHGMIVYMSKRPLLVPTKTRFFEVAAREVIVMSNGSEDNTS